MMNFFRFAILLSALFIAVPAFAYHPEATRLLRRSKNYDEVRAIKVLHMALKRFPRDDRISFRLGYLFHKMNRRPEAETFYLKTIAIKPCHARSHNNLGNVYVEWSRQSQAIARFKKSIECQKEFALPHYNLGNVHRKSNRLSKAVVAYKNTLKHEPDHRRAHHNLALVYIRYLNEMDTLESKQESPYKKLALRHINRAIQLGPRDAISYYNRGRLYEITEQHAIARLEYERCYKLLSESSAFRGRVLKKIKQMQARLLKTT